MGDVGNFAHHLFAQPFFKRNDIAQSSSQAQATASKLPYSIDFKNNSDESWTFVILQNYPATNMRPTNLA
jgi:hypothetical protein